jgi:hypothetical protein
MTNEHTPLLAHLLPKLPGSTENAAVEALAYILSNSEASKGAFNTLVSEGVSRSVARISRVNAQSTAEDGTRPDLVGLDEEEEKRVILEAKFWAGLTENQPNQYLEQLSGKGPAVLLFVGPDARLESLWEEVRRRSEEASHQLVSHVAHDRIRSGRLEGTDRHIMVVSWINLLNRMLERVRDAEEPRVESDIRQLLGLAEVMDREAFLPIRDEELDHGPGFARRMLQLKDLIDPVIRKGRDEHWADTEGLRTVIWRNGYGRYFRFSGLETTPWFGVYETLWAAPDAENTPLWVWLSRRDPTLDGLSLIQLNGLRDRLGLRLHQDSDGFWAPILLKPRADKDQLVAHIIAQLREIGEVLTVSQAGPTEKA